MLLQMKEWLCLNCQMQRASGPPKPAQPKPIKAPALAPQMDVQASLPNLSLQQGSKGDTSTKPVLSQTETSKNKSGFGLNHDTSKAPSTQPAASIVSENVVGFGSSIVSTASDIIAPAVQDEASVKRPSHRKGSAASAPSTLHKVSVVSEKDSSSKDSKSITQQPASVEKISERHTTKEQSAEVKADSLSTCPLCNDKFQNNPPNFNTCTSCKMPVCNLCGFNPMPDQSEVGPRQSPKYIALYRNYKGSRMALYIYIYILSNTPVSKVRVRWRCTTTF